MKFLYQKVQMEARTRESTTPINIELRAIEPLMIGKLKNYRIKIHNREIGRMVNKFVIILIQMTLVISHSCTN